MKSGPGQEIGRRKQLAGPVMAGSLALMALALRTYRVESQSIWYDELFALMVSRLPWGEMNTVLVRDVVHPPLHYYALHGWFKAFGFGPLQGRMLSVLCGTLAVGMIYLLAQYLFDRRTALLSALLLTISQLAIMCSQEARSYALLLLIFLGCTYLFLRALREKRPALWAGFLALACLAIYTHYYAFFVLGALLLFALAYRKRYPLPWTWLWGGALFMALGYAPWLASGVVGQALHGGKVQKINAMAHVDLLPRAHWFSLITSLNGFNNGRMNGLLETSPWWTIIVGGILFSLPAVWALRPLLGRGSAGAEVERERENLVYLVLLTAVPMALAFGVGSGRGAYEVKYVAFCAAPYYILAAHGIARQSSAAWRWALVAAILAYSGCALRANYFIPYKEDYQQALAFVARDYRPGDCAVVAPTWEERQARWAWSIYESGGPDLRILPLEAFPAAPGQCERVWLISVLHRENFLAERESRAARQKLAQDGLWLDRRRFFWVDVDLYGTAAAPPTAPQASGLSR
jgi:uncharacterized membrane protein